MTRKETLDAAAKCVCGDRETDYGSPEDSFAVIAKLWNTYLAHSNHIGITASDVAMMMALLKVGRIISGRVKEDSYIDCAGYIACAAEIDTKGM